MPGGYHAIDGEAPVSETSFMESVKRFAQWSHCVREREFSKSGWQRTHEPTNGESDSLRAYVSVSPRRRCGTIGRDES